MAQSRREKSRQGRQLKVEQQVDVNGEAITQNIRRIRRRELIKPEIKPEIVKPIRPVKKGKLHRALERVIKKTGISPKIKIENKLSNMRTGRISKKNEVEKITVDMRDLSEEDLYLIMNTIEAYSAYNGSSYDFADNLGWKLLKARGETVVYEGGSRWDKHKFSLGNSSRMYGPLDYENMFRRKNIPQRDRVKTSVFLVELKKELAHSEGILIGNKAFKEKKFNSRVEGRI